MENPFKFFSRGQKLSDVEIIIGLQNHNAHVEKLFFKTFYDYFQIHFNRLFFDKDSKSEIFQSSIIKLWTEIENRKIKVVDGKVFRNSNRYGLRPMTASLTTFMMAFAKNEFRELLRDVGEDNLDILISTGTIKEIPGDTEDEEENRMQIVDECILGMSPNCLEILTMFYYEKKSLDEILSIRGDQNTSKDGLKTAKNKCMNTLRRRVNERITLVN